MRVDRKTGKVTVVGEGTATITATAKVGDVVTTDALTVTVSKSSENTGDGGEGGGTGGGTGVSPLLQSPRLLLLTALAALLLLLLGSGLKYLQYRKQMK